MDLPSDPGAPKSTGRGSTAPTGTFMARARGGAVEFPSPVRRFCEASGWTLFRVLVIDDDCLGLRPVLPGDTSKFGSGHHSSLSPEGKLWIPAALRQAVGLAEQSVMLRVEEGEIRIYLRKVFKTLGFGP